MTDDAGNGKKGITRRSLLKAGAVAGAAGVVAGPASMAAAVVQEPPQPAGPPDIILTRGKIHTLDEANSVVSSVAIKDGKFIAAGRDGRGGPNTQVIDLRGRTVIPGLIESHTHFVSLANRPGYHVPELELARNIAEVLDFIAARRPDVPDGEFITAMGGWALNHWEENRLPTRAELDGAVPDRPVYIQVRNNGPAVVNSLGKAFFETVTSPLAGPVAVGDDGSIAQGLPTTTALYHLRVRRTDADKQRQAVDAQKYSAKVGVTTVLDQTLPPSPGPLNPNQPLSGLDHFRMYDGWLAAHAAGENYIRLQANFLHNQGFIPELGDLANQLPELRQRLRNQFPFFGNEWVRTGGIGEWAAPFALASANPNGYAVWYEAQRLVAQARWRNENSPNAPANIQQAVETYEAMDAEFGITDLRWGLQHCDLASPDQLARLRDLNVSISTSGHRWQTAASGGVQGPLFQQMLASGIKLALHQDGVHIAPHNPWYVLYYASTGINIAGVQINAGQQVSREQALRLMTHGAAWFLNRENELGSIEPGKWADLLVLDRDYFTVSDADMRRTKPVLSVVNGKIVHTTGAVG